MSKRTQVAIIGAGHLGQQLAHYLSHDSRYSVLGFYDDTQEPGTNIVINGRDFSVLGGLEDSLNPGAELEGLVMGIGYNHLAFRRELFERIVAGGQSWISYVHPSVIMDPSTVVEEGALVFAGCVLDKGVVIGANSLLNVGCVISHDSLVGPHTFLGPGVTVAGFSQIGAECFIGIRTTVIDNVTIGPACQTGGGTTVIEDLNGPGLWVGSPARKVR